MKKKYDESTSNFRIKFYGADNIDASTLATSLDNIVGTIKEITIKTQPEAYAKLNVTSTQKGCFEVNISTIIKYIPHLFSKDNVLVAQAILNGFFIILQIKKHLKGKKPKEIKEENDKKIIINYKDEQYVADRQITATYLDSAKIDNCTVNIFTALKEDPNRDDMLLESKTENIKIKKEEYDNMAAKIIEEMKEDEELFTQVIETPLLLKKPDLLGNSKWGFVFTKNIEAEIKDIEWLKKVHSGEIKLFAGVKIPVKLLIEIELDEYKNPKNEPKYSIIEVMGDVILPMRNKKLFN